MVRVDVPAGAVLGSQDVSRLIVTAQGDPTKTGSARATTLVLAGLSVAPDNAGAGGAGTWVSYRHTVTNSWPTTRTVTLAATSSRSWSTGVYAENGVTPISALTLGPNGGSADVWVRVLIPATATVSVVDTTTLSAVTGTTTATATDVTTVRRLAVYTSASYALEGREYSQGGTVYGRATGLGGYTQVYFVWKDPTGATSRTSPTRDVDDEEMAFDAFDVPLAGLEGTWTVELHDAKNGALIETVPFGVHSNAKITALSATDAATIGASTQVTSSLRNNSQDDIVNSSVRYLIWWDTDGDGTFDAGDLYIDASGNPQTYSGTGNPTTHVTTGVDVASKGEWTDPGWSMSNANFPNQGSYNLTATWVSSTGTVIDVKTTQFFSVPTLGEIVAKLTAPSLPLLVLMGIVWVGALAALRRRRRWLSFYALGALGTVLMALFATQAIGLDQWLETIEARQVAAIAHSLQINVSFLPPSGLAIENHVGWGVFDVGIECSALLEMAAFAGLVGFYPGFSAVRKAYLVLAGVMATYVINIFRILIIVNMIAELGTGYVFVAHAVVGRLFFFTGVVVVYWVLVTMPTVRTVFARLQAVPAEATAGGGAGRE